MVFDFSAIRVPRQKHYSDSTLMTWNKKELIEYIRMLEHNYDVSIQFNENQAQYIEGFCPFFTADRKTEPLDKDTNVRSKKDCDNCGTPKHLCKYCIEEDRMWTPKDEPQTEGVANE